MRCVHELLWLLHYVFVCDNAGASAFWSAVFIQQLPESTRYAWCPVVLLSHQNGASEWLFSALDVIYSESLTDTNLNDL